MDYFDLTTGTKVALNAKENLINTLNVILPGKDDLTKKLQTILDDAKSESTKALGVDWIKLLASTNNLFDEILLTTEGNKWQIPKGLGDLSEIAAIEDLKNDLIAHIQDVGLAALLSPDIDKKEFAGLGQQGSIVKVSVVDIISSDFEYMNKKILSGISIKMKKILILEVIMLITIFLDNVTQIRKFINISEPDKLAKQIKYIRANTTALEKYSKGDVNSSAKALGNKKFWKRTRDGRNIDSC